MKEGKLIRLEFLKEETNMNIKNQPKYRHLQKLIELIKIQAK